jgi:hypothetical protein
MHMQVMDAPDIRYQTLVEETKSTAMSMVNIVWKISAMRSSRENTQMASH